MSYPWVAARWFSHNAIIEVRGLVLHFSEGGGTVKYLTDPRRTDGSSIDVSAHFVLERTGRIVQMVRDEDADHCQHISRGSWSYPGDLNRANGVAVLGSDVMDSPDATRVNRYVQAIEIEGFRETGMNAAQTGSLTAWVEERRAKFPTIRGLLGHGDIQDKACPGRLIPWAELGGHGLAQEDEVRFVNANSASVSTGKHLSVPKGQPWKYLDGSAGGAFAGAATVPVLGTADAHSFQYVVEITTASPYADKVGRKTLVLVESQTALTDAPALDCTDAVTAEHERTRAKAIAAVEAI